MNNNNKSLETFNDKTYIVYVFLFFFFVQMLNIITRCFASHQYTRADWYYRMRCMTKSAKKIIKQQQQPKLCIRTNEDVEIIACELHRLSYYITDDDSQTTNSRLSYSD